ncbi:hypothetical protein Bca4012_025863 [Brassica carinata]
MMRGSTPAVLIGSHMDTVIDAGKYDGSLGIISAISALKVLKVNGKLGELKRPVEVIACSDEEGVRFQCTFLGSAALAGIMPVSRLETDKSGITVQDALKEKSIDITEENLMQLKYDPASVWGYVEVMYDATGVRLHAGRQAEVLNQIVYKLPAEHPLAESIPLCELLGHTPPQVVAGGVLGTVTAVFGYLITLTVK